MSGFLVSVKYYIFFCIFYHFVLFSSGYTSSHCG